MIVQVFNSPLCVLKKGHKTTHTILSGVKSVSSQNTGLERVYKNKTNPHNGLQIALCKFCSALSYHD